MGLALTLVCAVVAAQSLAKGENFDKTMQPLLEEYLKISDALAADKMEGVAEAANKIVALSPKIAVEDIEDAHKDHLKDIPAKLKVGAEKLAAAKNIEAMRDAFSELSKPMAMWATMLKAKEINVIYCSMKPGSWLQKDKKIRNPYYGANMLTCGQILSGPDAPKPEQKEHSEHKSGEESHHQHH